MPEKKKNLKTDPMLALNRLKQAREACLSHLEKLQAKETRTAHDYKAGIKVISEYVETVAKPMQELFNKKLELLTPELNKAVATFCASQNITLDKDGVKAAMKGESDHPELNTILVKFYKQNLSPKYKIDEEIKLMLKMRDELQQALDKMS